MDQGPCNEKWCAIHNKPVKTTSQHMDHHLFMIEDVHIYTCLGGGGGEKKKRGGGGGGGGKKKKKKKKKKKFLKKFYIRLSSLCKNHSGDMPRTVLASRRGKI